MKILFVNAYFYPFTPGGAEWSIWYLAKALVKKGHQVGILTPNYGAKSFEIKKGIKIYRFPFPVGLSQGQHSVRYFYHVNPLFYLYNAFWILKIAKRENYQLIHSQNRFSLPGSFLAAKLLRKPVFFYIRDSSSFCPISMCVYHFDRTGIKDCDLKNFWQNCSREYLHFYLNQPRGLKKMVHQLILLYFWLDNRLQRFCLNRVTAITSVSQGILDLYQKSGVIKKPPAKVIYNLPPLIAKKDKKALAVLKKKIGLKKEKVVLYEGRFSRGKGTDMFLKAARNILKKRKDVLFVLAGRGKLENQERQIKILGSLPHDLALQLFYLADLVVVPSKKADALSRILLASLAAQKPLIGTRVGGTPETIKEGINGYLIKRDDAKALEEKIEKLLDDDKLRGKMARGSRIILKEKFNQEKIIKKLINLYSKFLSHGVYSQQVRRKDFLERGEFKR